MFKLIVMCHLGPISTLLIVACWVRTSVFKEKSGGCKQYFVTLQVHYFFSECKHKLASILFDSRSRSLFQIPGTRQPWRDPVPIFFGLSFQRTIQKYSFPPFYYTLLFRRSAPPPPMRAGAHLVSLKTQEILLIYMYIWLQVHVTCFS